jgi:diketogulonate reductase-like aldo/keto reductase
MSVPSSSVTTSNSLRSDVRQSVLQLIDRTTPKNKHHDDVIDTLQVKYNPQSPYFLDAIDCLIDLQREGYVRSIGVHNNIPIRKLREACDIFPSYFDFQKHDGNLLLPASSNSNKDCCYHPDLNIWMTNTLANTILQHDQQQRKGSITLQEKMLNEWATRRCPQQHNDDDQYNKSSFKSKELWKMYQEEIYEPLKSIALKHRVSVSAIALRWVLECGGDNVLNYVDNSTGIVSCAIVDCIVDTEDFHQNVQLRQVFKFALDEEDKEMLHQISARPMSKQGGTNKQQQQFAEEVDVELDGLNDWQRELILYQNEIEKEHEIQDYPEIDFSNKALWL